MTRVDRAGQEAGIGGKNFESGAWRRTNVRQFRCVHRIRIAGGVEKDGGTPEGAERGREVYRPLVPCGLVRLRGNGTQRRRCKSREANEKKKDAPHKILSFLKWGNGCDRGIIPERKAEGKARCPFGYFRFPGDGRRAARAAGENLV